MILKNITMSFITCNIKKGMLLKYPSSLSGVQFALSFDRGAHTQNITKNIQYISNDNVEIVTDPKTMKLNRSSNKPLCIMLDWLMAKQKQVMKYSDIYLEEGFDVIRVFCKPWQLLWPRKGAQLIGRDLIKLMAVNEGSYVVHGFSVGGYVWSEALVHATKDKELYQSALDRVEAQAWDSVADITEFSVGLPLALFPTNKLAQHATQFLINFYLRAFYILSTRHYQRACETYYATPCRAPALFLLSSVDPVGNEQRIRRAYNVWLEMGIQSTWKCWPDSAHVMHYLSHPDEYTSLVRTHIRDNVSALRTCAQETRPYERERELIRAILPVLDRVEAQVWDSFTDVTHCAVGFPIAMFPKNKLAQLVAKLFINFHLHAFSGANYYYYERCLKIYYEIPCRSPALFLLSRVAPVGSEDRIRRVYNLWTQMGIKCTWKCWPNSAHVKHYLSYPEEYAALVQAHIRNNVKNTHVRKNHNNLYANKQEQDCVFRIS